MTRQELLEKAIAKAIAGGCNIRISKSDTGTWVIYRNQHMKIDGQEERMVSKDIILDHEFAKALWKDAPTVAVVWKNFRRETIAGWQYHLQQMVIAEDPIEYLRCI